MFSAWKLIPTMVVIVALAAGFSLAPPRAAVSARELRRLVLAIIALYCAGGLTLALGRLLAAEAVFGTALLLCSVALWLSRGRNPPPRDEGDGGGGGQPPVDPPPRPEFDWSFYEEQFREPVA